MHEKITTTEAKAKDLYTKAFGLDEVKPKYESERQKRTELEGEINNIRTEINTILEHKQKGDLGAFFGSLGLTDDQVASYMLEKIKQRELPPEQQKVYTDLEALRRESSSKDKQVQEMNRMWQQAASQARRVELDSVLARTDINQLMRGYEGRIKKPGAFRDLVIKHALAEFHTTGKDLTADEAAKAVMEMLGDVYTSQGEDTSSVAEVKALPVIPNVGGRNVSPTQKIPRSIEDLKKIRAEMIG